MKLKLTDIPVVYINLDDQPERKELLEKNLKDLVEYLESKNMFFTNEKDLKGPK